MWLWLPAEFRCSCLHLQRRSDVFLCLGVQGVGVGCLGVRRTLAWALHCSGQRQVSSTPSRELGHTRVRTRNLAREFISPVSQGVRNSGNRTNTGVSGPKQLCCKWFEGQNLGSREAQLAGWRCLSEEGVCRRSSSRGYSGHPPLYSLCHEADSIPAPKSSLHPWTKCVPGDHAGPSHFSGRASFVVVFVLLCSKDSRGTSCFCSPLLLS